MTVATFYLCNCKQCDAASGRALAIPFGSETTRSDWMTKHTDGTGHTQYTLSTENNIVRRGLMQ